MPHMLKSHIEDADAADKAEGRCYMTRDVTGLPKKTSSKDKSRHGPKVIKVAPRCTSLFYGRTEKNNPLRVLVNIPWHSSSLGNSIFYHNGSRRTSAWERILAELGTFQGPGLRVPFGLCRVPRMLFMEDTMPSLLLTSLE